MRTSLRLLIAKLTSITTTPLFNPSHTKRCSRRNTLTIKFPWRSANFTMATIQRLKNVFSGKLRSSRIPPELMKPITPRPQTLPSKESMYTIMCTRRTYFK